MNFTKAEAIRDELEQISKRLGQIGDAELPDAVADDIWSNSCLAVGHISAYLRVAEEAAGHAGFTLHHAIRNVKQQQGDGK